MFRQIPIEISVGCIVVAVTPVRVPKGQNSPVIEIIHSNVVNIIMSGAEKWIYLENPTNSNSISNKPVIEVPEWRVVRYTYGGIWLGNFKFDQRRIDAENLLIVAQYQGSQKAVAQKVP